MSNQSWHKNLTPMLQLTLEAKLQEHGYTPVANRNKRGQEWSWWSTTKVYDDENTKWAVQFYTIYDKPQMALYLWKARAKSRPCWRKVGSKQAKRFWVWLMGSEDEFA